MKELKKDLRSVVRDLKALTKATEKLIKKVDKLGKAPAAKKPKAKAPAKAVKKRIVKKAAKATASDTVLKIIQKRKRGITTAEIKQKTGFKEKKIWDIVNRAKRQGKVKSLSKGVYIKA